MGDKVNSMVNKHILFCKCGGERISHAMIDEIDLYLKRLPVEVTVLSDLCGLVANGNESLAELLSHEKDFLVIACYRRTMDLLFDQIRNDTYNKFSFSHINMLQSASNQEVIEKINGFIEGAQSISEHNEIADASNWPSWYPVIDYSRCTACGQCADFCLFGVYEKTENRIIVDNPHGCKNNCPACARVCPATAIIFPKYVNGGAIGGSDEIDALAEHKRQAMDIEQILGNDLYAALEKRKAKRRSIISDDAMNKALLERDKALTNSNSKKE